MLQNLIVKSKTVEIEYPYAEGFKVQIAYLTKEEIIKLRKKATTSKFNKFSRQAEESFDDELFTNIFVGATIKGWTGLTFDILGEMFPIDTSEADEDITELPYSPEDAVILMKNSVAFDDWITEVSNDISVFTKGK